MSLCCAAAWFRPLSAQASTNWTIEGVLGMMDKSAQDFHTLTADIEHIKYTAVVKDTSTETGHIFVRRDEKMRIEITKPDLRTILRTGDSLFVYNPKINRVEEFDLGKNRSMVDQYVLLGFGTKSDNIKKWRRRARPKEDCRSGVDPQIRSNPESNHQDSDVGRRSLLAARSAEVF
ncbi:MAG: hypothetical protein DMG47_03260 [Acidobacteria bacterium]|nr:MAG: hypothetical protein DMG47_03260 [Acidobacteriota bacterium]